MKTILSGISFEECKASGYAARTRENVLNSDGTLAIGLDPSSPGEKCTHRACEEAGKPYLWLFYDTLLMPKSLQRAWDFMVEYRIENLNGAGNSLYRLKGDDQFEVSAKIYSLLSFLMDDSGPVVEGGPTLMSVRSGGQTGLDEAFLHAARALLIPAHCLAPKGWIYRSEEGRDIYGEESFKSRFL